MSRILLFLFLGLSSTQAFIIWTIDEHGHACGHDLDGRTNTFTSIPFIPPSTPRSDEAFVITDVTEAVQHLRTLLDKHPGYMWVFTGAGVSAKQTFTLPELYKALGLVHHSHYFVTYESFTRMLRIKSNPTEEENPLQQQYLAAIARFNTSLYDKTLSEEHHLVARMLKSFGDRVIFEDANIDGRMQKALESRLPFEEELGRMSVPFLGDQSEFFGPSDSAGLERTRKKFFADHFPSVVFTIGLRVNHEGSNGPVLSHALSCNPNATIVSLNLDETDFLDPQKGRILPFVRYACDIGEFVKGFLGDVSA